MIKFEVTFPLSQEDISFLKALLPKETNHEVIRSSQETNSQKVEPIVVTKKEDEVIRQLAPSTSETPILDHFNKNGLGRNDLAENNYGRRVTMKQAVINYMQTCGKALVPHHELIVALRDSYPTLASMLYQMSSEKSSHFCIKAHTNYSDGYKQRLYSLA